MTSVVKFEQLITEDASAGVEFSVSSPFKIVGSGSFTLSTWNGATYSEVGVVDLPSFIASAGKYQALSEGAVSITITPEGRS